MNHTGKLRNMASIYIRHNDKMLLLYRQGSSVVNNLWIGSAGGHFEESELNDAKACVLRELKEELSMTEEMICNLELRYITLKQMDGEIRQNYYFFADLADNIPMQISSNEGIAKWFSLQEVPELEMPFTARYVINHYLETGMHNHTLYGGIAGGSQVIFIEMDEN